MKTYLLTMTFLSFLSGGMLYLAKGRRFEKHLRYLSSLILLLCLLSPLKSLLSSDLSALFEGITAPPASFQSGYGELLTRESARALEEELTAQIEKKTALGKDEFSVEIRLKLNGTELSVDEVVCRLFSVAAAAKREKIAAVLAQVGEDAVFIEELG